MPNVLNQRMLTEIEAFLTEAQDCVFIDFKGMSVDDAEEMRNQLRDDAVRMRVIKSSLAKIAARNLGYEDADEVLSGPTAICYGGDSVATVARKVKEFARGKKSPQVRGGLLDKKVIGVEQVETLANLPSREELLAQVIGTIIAPATQSLGAMVALLTAVPGLTKALEEKISEGSGSEG